MSGLVEEVRPASVPSVVTAPVPAAAPARPAYNDDPGGQQQTAAPQGPLPDDDPDAIALATARAEVAALDALATGGGAVPAAPALPTPPPAAPAAPAAAPQDIMVPKARFDAVLRELRVAKDQAVYLQGALAARTQAPGPAAPGATPPPAAKTLEDQIIELRQAVLDAAKKLDAGEITFADFTEFSLRATTTIEGIRSQQIAAAIRQSAPAPTAPVVGLADQKLIADNVAALEAAHPWVTVMKPGELAYLTNAAKQEFVALGRPLGTGPAETVRLQKAVAELADVYGPRWYPQSSATAPAPQPSAAPPAPAPAPSPRVAAAERKLAVAAAHPPNIAGAGTPASGNVVTLDQVEGMTEAEIEALPDAVRARFIA